MRIDPFSQGHMRHLGSGSTLRETLLQQPATGPGYRSAGRNRWIFDPGTGRDTETSLAVDPKDADRILVAWQEDITRIWTARTQDGGRNWRVEVLHDPGSNSPAGGQEGFDPTAAIGPDGTMYVLVGVSQVPGGLSLIRLDDGEDGWTFHPVDELGDAHLWDAMHLAVAPDTGALYAVAQSIDHRGIGFWKSSDRGDSWSTVRFPHVETPQSAAQAAQDGFNYWPRIAAGRGGLVQIVTKSLLGNASKVRVTVSSDGGESFGPLAPLTTEQLSGRLVGVPPSFDGSNAIAGFVSDSQIVVASAKDGAGAWRLERFPRYDPTWDPDWSTVASGNGTVWILHTEQNSDPTWRVLLTKIRDGSSSTVTLATRPTAQPRGANAGDEYGGLDVAHDGCVWASWAQPGPAGSPVISVTKRC